MKLDISAMSFANSGPLILLFAEEGQIADLDIVLPVDVNLGDRLRISFVLREREGDGLNLFHGGELVQSIQNHGRWTVEHIATRESGLVRFRMQASEAPQSYVIGALSIDLNP